MFKGIDNEFYPLGKFFIDEMMCPDAKHFDDLSVFGIVIFQVNVFLGIGRITREVIERV